MATENSCVFSEHRNLCCHASEGSCRRQALQVHPVFFKERKEPLETKDHKTETSRKEEGSRRYWLKLLPAAAVITALTLAGVRAESKDSEKTAVSSQKIMSAKELEGFLAYEGSEEADSAEETKTKAADKKTSSKKNSGKIKTASAKRSLPASSSGGSSGGGMGSTYTPVAQIPASGYKDGTYQGSGTGFGGTITVSVTVSGGKITSVNILNASGETPSYFSSAQGVISRVIASQSPNVDAVSGATYSSNGIISAIQNALSQAAADIGEQIVRPTPTPQPAKKPKPAKKPSSSEPEGIDGYKDGTYQGTGTGFNGEVVLTVKIQNGVIKKISAEHQDTESFFHKAWEKIKPEILKKQSIQGIDTVSGATYSSIGILDAMRQVMEQAGYKAEPTPEITPTPTPEAAPEATPIPEETPAPEATPAPGEEENPDSQVTPAPDAEATPTPGIEDTTEPTPEATPSPEPEGPYMDGTYSGSAWGYLGRVNITVTISGGQIVSIEQSNKDTAEYFNTAWSTIFPQVMAQQSADGIDTVSGATFSSEGIIGGMQSALSQAAR